MSLRLRLVLLTLALVALVAVALSALQVQTMVDSFSQETVNRANIAANQTSAFLIDHINQHALNYPTPESPEQTAVTWTTIVETDPEFLPYFYRTMTNFDLIEINVADSGGRILQSSTPGLTGQQVQAKERFAAWSQRPWYTRAWDLMRRPRDWEVSPRPIGIEGGNQSLFQIQVVTSSLLVRKNLEASLWRMATVFGVLLGTALVIALLATHSALRPLQRIERTIDRITQGHPEADSGAPLAKEFQALQSKLDILGQKVAQPVPSGKLDVLVEQVATQFDVASRLSAISRLSSGVAHEIKNPLNAILLRLDLLKVRLGDSDEEVGQELDVLSKEVLRLNRVVTTFLDFSRPVEVHFEDVDLAALAREVAELVRPQAAVTNITVQCDAPGPAPMRGDPDLLKQALLNLVTNAVEAMPGGGELRVNVRASGTNWIAEVADTGPGIPVELRDKVFQLYFTSKTKGSGIGLAMTYRAAQLHNGTVSFTSETGLGTTFRLEVPATGMHG